MRLARAVGLCAAALVAAFAIVQSSALAAQTKKEDVPIEVETSQASCLWEDDSFEPALLTCAPMDELAGVVEELEKEALEHPEIWKKKRNRWIDVESATKLCSSLKASPGIVESSLLSAKLGWIDKGKGEVGIEEGPSEAGDLFAEFTCDTTNVRVRGSVVGTVSPINKIVTPREHFTYSLIAEGGKQAVTHLEGESPHELEISYGGGLFHPVPTDDIGKIKPARPLEITTAGGQPSITLPNEPTYHECAKATKVGKHFTGRFDDKKCSTANPLEQGKYELQEGVGKGKAFKGKGGAATLFVPSVAGEVKCEASKSSGKVSTPATWSGVVVAFTKCATTGKKCTSMGANPGEIRTNPLEGFLGYIKESPLHVGVSLAGEAGQPFASANCEGIAVSIGGALIGEITGDIGAFSKTSSVAFTVNGGHVQVPTAFEGRPAEVLESTIGGSGPFETSEQTTISMKGEELEITP